MRGKNTQKVENFELSEENIALGKAITRAQEVTEPSLRSAILQALEVIGRAQILRLQKKRHDERDRALIGVMLPKEEAEKYKRIAKASDRRITHFCRDALETEYQKWISDTLSIEGAHER